MKDVLICLDIEHDSDSTSGAPIFDAPHDQPIWALYEVEDGAEDWGVKFHAKGLTHKQAEELADALGLTGRRIG